ncbi:dynamin-binding protein-like protein, partial [Leptotrombidium deliense]
MSKTIVKITHDYAGQSSEELNVYRDDIVQVSKVIDRQWLYGHCNGYEGNFPSSCATEIEFQEQLSEGHEVFAVISDFHGEESNDLVLKRGDLVLGLQPLDANWWNGRVIGSQRVG